MPDEPFDEHLEWDRDGQYYHYLTKWMHALSRVSLITEDPVFIRWALELAQTAHSAFTYSAPGGKRMYWKMSVDLKHPQVNSMGQHDPLDGYITYNELKETAGNFSLLCNLIPEIKDMAEICHGLSWVTNDPLGIGGLLSDALRVAQLIVKEGSVDEKISPFKQLLENLLNSAVVGLESYMRNDPQEFPAKYRLAFREMGLSIGIKGLNYLQSILESNKNLFMEYDLLKPSVEVLKEYKPLAISLEKFWLEDENRACETWTEHREINMVMLATSLAPRGFLEI